MKPDMFYLGYAAQHRRNSVAYKKDVEVVPRIAETRNKTNTETHAGFRAFPSIRNKDWSAIFLLQKFKDLLQNSLAISRP